MRTLIALLCLSAPAPAQEPPHPPQGTTEARERAALEARARDLKAALEGLPQDSPERGPKETELRRVEDELRRLRQPRPPQPPDPAFPPGAQRPRPVMAVDEIRAWLREHEPETFRRLMGLQEQGRRPEVMEILAGAEGRIHQLKEMEARDPKGYARMLALRKLEQETLELGERARSAEGEERAGLSERLRDAVGRLFDLREEIRAQEIEELKRRVGALERALDGRKANRERIVENRRRALLGEIPDEGW